MKTDLDHSSKKNTGVISKTIILKVFTGYRLGGNSSRLKHLLILEIHSTPKNKNSMKHVSL